MKTNREKMGVVFIVMVSLVILFIAGLIPYRAPSTVNGVAEAEDTWTPPEEIIGYICNRFGSNYDGGRLYYLGPNYGGGGMTSTARIGILFIGIYQSESIICDVRVGTHIRMKVSQEISEGYAKYRKATYKVVTFDDTEIVLKLVEEP